MSEPKVTIANIVDDMTARLLVDARISAGMRVLDVGCGRGDVSLLIARLVGNEGEVLGVDRDVHAVATARERARELGLANITFAVDDFCELSPRHGSFDAIVGRRVLMYQSDPVDAVRRLVRALRCGGPVIFQEHDSTVVPGHLPMPLHERVHGWIWQTVEREGANIHMGLELPSVLEQAGVTVERVRAEAIVQTSSAHYSSSAIIRAMLPRIIRQGVATEKEIDVGTLDQRLIEEREEAKATYVGDMVFGAWARKARQTDEPI